MSAYLEGGKFKVFLPRSSARRFFSRPFCRYPPFERYVLLSTEVMATDVDTLNFDTSLPVDNKVFCNAWNLLPLLSHALCCRVIYQWSYPTAGEADKKQIYGRRPSLSRFT